MVRLLHYTPYEVLMYAIRVSHSSEEKSDSVGNILGAQDYALLYSIIKQKHDSVLEHIVYSFEITDISRALLQELARHRHISMTVQSTRFTLKRLLKHKKELAELCVIPASLPLKEVLDYWDIVEDILKHVKSPTISKKNDILKYLLPECFKTKLVLTVNARELAHILTLRSAPNALPEFQCLSKELFEEVVKVHPDLWHILQEREGWKWRCVEDEECI